MQGLKSPWSSVALVKLAFDSGPPFDKQNSGLYYSCMVWSKLHYPDFVLLQSIQSKLLCWWLLVELPSWTFRLPRRTTLVRNDAFEKSYFKGKKWDPKDYSHARSTGVAKKLHYNRKWVFLQLWLFWGNKIVESKTDKRNYILAKCLVLKMWSKAKSVRYPLVLQEFLLIKIIFVKTSLIVENMLHKKPMEYSKSNLVENIATFLCGNTIKR